MPVYSALPGWVSLATSFASRYLGTRGCRAPCRSTMVMWDVEHAGILTHRVVLIKLRAVVQRHHPAVKVYHAHRTPRAGRYSGVCFAIFSLFPLVARS